MCPVIAKAKLTRVWWRGWSNGTLVLNFSDASVVTLPPKLKLYCSQLLRIFFRKRYKSVVCNSTKGTKITTIIFWSKWSSLNSQCYIWSWTWQGERGINHELGSLQITQFTLKSWNSTNNIFTLFPGFWAFSFQPSFSHFFSSMIMKAKSLS